MHIYFNPCLGSCFVCLTARWKQTLPGFIRFVYFLSHTSEVNWKLQISKRRDSMQHLFLLWIKYVSILNSLFWWNSEMMKMEDNTFGLKPSSLSLSQFTSVLMSVTSCFCTTWGQTELKEQSHSFFFLVSTWNLKKSFHKCKWKRLVPLTKHKPLKTKLQRTE